jgi:hypothetical protein
MELECTERNEIKGNAITNNGKLKHENKMQGERKWDGMEGKGMKRKRK